MPTRTPAPAAQQKEPLVTYVVVADAVNLTTGRKPNGTSSVTRLMRGAEINAPASHPSVRDLLSMNGIVRKDDLDTTMRAIAKKGNAKRPTAQRLREGFGHRVTAAGVQAVLGSEDDPALKPLDEAAPIPAPEPDLTPTES